MVGFFFYFFFLDAAALAHRVAELEEELSRVREDSEKQVKKKKLGPILFLTYKFLGLVFGWG